MGFTWMKYQSFLSTVCFKVFDSDQDGRLNEAEVTAMCEALKTVRQEYNSEATLVSLRFLFVFFFFINSNSSEFVLYSVWRSLLCPGLILVFVFKIIKLIDWNFCYNQVALLKSKTGKRKRHFEPIDYSRNGTEKIFCKGDFLSHNQVKGIGK